MHDNQFQRTERLLGPDALTLLNEATVTICGCGAVGGFAIEALARMGIGNIRLIDFDVVEETNLNRQILALHSTIGKSKTELAKDRILDINPSCRVTVLNTFITEENVLSLIEGSTIVIDAIDSVSSKLALLKAAYLNRIRIVSSMGAALRRDVSLIKTGDIMDTKGCPLAKRLRGELRKAGIKRGINVVYSTERVIFEYRGFERAAVQGRKNKVLGSLPTITAIFGETLAHLALTELLPKDTLKGHSV